MARYYTFTEWDQHHYIRISIMADMVIIIPCNLCLGNSDQENSAKNAAKFLKNIPRIYAKMSCITEEELAKIMRPGLRVIRGKDWQRLSTYPTRSVNEDGNGEGTITKISPIGTVCHVKWDHDGSELLYNQGATQSSGDLFFLKLAEQKPLESKKWKKMPEKLFKAKELVDAKIICEGKTFECHKSVLGCQSDVFTAMFLNNSMVEANSGEIKIDDFEAEVIETMIYFIYNDEIQDKKKITADLLRAAEKYNLVDLVELCVIHLKSSLSLDSVLDVLVVAHLTNQKELFDAASDFVEFVTL